MEKPKRQSPSIYLKHSLKQIFNETSALTTKNFLIFYRNLYVSFLLMVLPFLICLYLQKVQDIVDNFGLDLEDPDPTEYSLSTITKCESINCTTLGIGLTSGQSEWTDYIISHISKTHKLQIGKDIKVITDKDPLDFINYFKTHQNSTQTGVILCSNKIDFPNSSHFDYLNCNQNNGQVYLILYNFTETSQNMFDTSLPDPLDTKVLTVKLALDNAILSYHASKKGLGEILIEIVVSAFPLPPNRFLKGYDAVSMTGPMYFFIPPMFVFGLLIAEIVKEKELKLRNGLSVIGVSATSFWLSWSIVAVFFSFMTTNSLILSAYYFQFEMFLKTPYLVMLLLFMTYTLTMIILGFLLSTFIKSVKLAYTISYTFLLGGLVLQNFFMSPLLMRLFHIIELPDWVPWVRTGFSYYPPFNFSKIFGDIAAKAGSLPNYHERRFESGPGYNWSDFFLRREGWIFGTTYSIPSSFSTFQDLLWNILFFCILTWYFDHVIEGNRGRSSVWYFFITKDYWGCRRRMKNSDIELRDVKGKSMERSDIDEVVEGLKLTGLWKKYPGSKTSAVKPLDLLIEKDECVAIIGHNGAGKTTLLSMLTGLLSPSGGTATIATYDICHDIDKVHSIIGYCPQFNILWEELTAREHLTLFAKLRNTCKELREELVNSKLAQVNLTKSADKIAKTYSGGMKRRLSVAISSIGNPSVIFMDEPTTGMDPITRREVWKLIQELKKDRVIILTTHSMEEAEILSDRVVVMVDGQIKCSGTCLYLKNHYGDGFKVEIIVDNPEELWKYLQKQISELKLIDISGNSLYVTLPHSRLEDAQQFFEIIENIQTQDWGIRNASLEEVFMKVTGKLQNLGTTD